MKSGLDEEEALIINTLDTKSKKNIWICLFLKKISKSKIPQKLTKIIIKIQFHVYRRGYNNYEVEYIIKLTP